MYASLIGAGISQLYDLYKSATESSGKTSAASKTSFQPSTDDAATSATKATGAVNSSGRSGGSLSDTVQKLLADLQSSTSGTATSDATNTIAGDLKSVSHKLGVGLGHGRHGGPPATASGSSNTFGNVANSLLAYAKTQSLTASSSASLTA